MIQIQAGAFTQFADVVLLAADFTAASTANNTPAPKQKAAEDKHRSRVTCHLAIGHCHLAWSRRPCQQPPDDQPASWRNVHNESVNVRSMTETVAVAFRGCRSLLGQYHVAYGG
jgi:hypothetical protein